MAGSRIAYPALGFEKLVCLGIGEGCVAAHHMSQIDNDHVRNSLYTNTALKFVARTTGDIFNLCRSMGATEPQFITTLPQYQFAYFGPNMREAISAKLPLVEFDRLPAMTGQQYAEIRARNRTRYAYIPHPAPAQPAPLHQSTPPAPDSNSPRAELARGYIALSEAAQRNDWEAVARLKKEIADLEAPRARPEPVSRPAAASERSDPNRDEPPRPRLQPEAGCCGARYSRTVGGDPGMRGDQPARLL
ncbi:MAG: hypothetical protein WA459_01105 [Stellaceae bacterium]